jgi:hypothetical protein
MKILIYKKNEDGSYGEILGSYDGPKDDSSANRSYLLAEPKASHFELPEGMFEECVDLVWVEEVLAVEPVEAQPEMWVKEGELSVFIDPLDVTWTHVPAVGEVLAVIYAPAHYELQANAEMTLGRHQANAQANLNSVRDLRNAKLSLADYKEMHQLGEFTVNP